jgi:hypothetical protein
MSYPVSVSTIGVTQQAQQIFEQNTKTLNKVLDSVQSAMDELTNSGSDPVSIDTLTSALDEWTDACYDIITMNQWMAEMLYQTWTQIQQNEQNNVDLADGLSVQPEPGEVNPPPPSGNGGTVAPGATTHFMRALIEPAPMEAALGAPLERSQAVTLAPMAPEELSPALPAVPAVPDAKAVPAVPAVPASQG